MSGTTAEYIRLALTVFSTAMIIVGAVFLRIAIDNVRESMSEIKERQDAMEGGLTKALIHIGAIEKMLGIETKIEDDGKIAAVSVDGGIFLLDKLELERRSEDFKPVA